MMNDVEISVVIATRNRSSSLSRLINELSAQVDAPPFEVIVGDNGSSDDTPKVVKNARNRLQIHYVREERPGKSRALNAALRIAQGKLIVFTDDDVVPQPDWLSQLYSASQRYPDVNIFGGQIDVNLEDVPSWIKRSFNLMGLLTSAHNFGNSDTRYNYGQYPFGPNMAIRRNCIKSLNKPYPEYIGPGTELPVGDETMFLSPFSPADSKDRIFIASACVTHDVEAENINFFGAFKRCYLAGRGGGILGFSTAATGKSKIISTSSLISQRLITCRSLRELICITIRFFGYLQGHYERRKKEFFIDGKIF